MSAKLSEDLRKIRDNLNGYKLNDFQADIGRCVGRAMSLEGRVDELRKEVEFESSSHD